MSRIPTVVLLTTLAVTARAEWRPVPLNSTIDGVQPWTGIVLWSDHEKNDTDAIQLEYSYLRYDDVAKSPGVLDWTRVDRLLEEIAGRGHQAILRFYFVYPGRPSSVPRFIKQRTDYKEITAKSEGETTGFVDWSYPAVQQFTLDFYREFAKRYDNDPRLAYLQTGFGLWAEYHIYDGPRKIGRTFPSRVFQAKFLRHMNQVFRNTPWMISIDAADGEYSPFEQQPDLLGLTFGLFDDSFLCKPHAKENAPNWRFFGGDRWQRSPAGGEFSYYTKRDQRLALSSDGPHGQSLAQAAKAFHITFMIGNDQPGYQSLEHIEAAGLETGYRLRITECLTNGRDWRITATNDGVAPMYHNAYVAVGGLRATQSLQHLLPGRSRRFEIRNVPDDTPTVAIESDRLVDGQRIQFNAHLP